MPKTEPRGNSVGLFRREDVELVDVRAGGHGERERADGEQQPGDAQRARTDERGDGGDEDRGEQDRQGERHRLEADVERTSRSSSPRVSAAPVNAPMPANAIWPSDSCPAHPVSTVSDSAQIVKAAIDAYTHVLRRLA